jgi:hypothetical protein
MATLGFSGMGAVLTFDGVTIGEIESIDGGEVTIDFEEILTMDSVSYYADMILTALNSGQVAITCIFQPSNTTGNYAKLKAKAEARTVGTLLLTYLNTANVTGQAGLISLQFPSAPDAKGVQRFTATFKRSGIFTYTGT